MGWAEKCHLPECIAVKEYIQGCLRYTHHRAVILNAIQLP